MPLYPSGYDEKKKLKLNETYIADIRLSRNPLFHAKFFALIDIAHNNTQLDLPFHQYRKHLIIKAGYYVMKYTPKGVDMDAMSISFDSMDQKEFEELYGRVLDEVIKDIGVDKEMIEKELFNFL